MVRFFIFCYIFLEGDINYFFSYVKYNIVIVMCFDIQLFDNEW